MTLWEKLITQMKHSFYKPKPKLTETGDIHYPLNKDLCLKYYKKL
jgi:hypothetical protein